MPIDQLYFQISNCNVFVYVTLANVFKVSIVTVLNCNVSCHKGSRLFGLRQLKKCGVSPADIILIYCSLIRSIVEYGFSSVCRSSSVSFWFARIYSEVRAVHDLTRTSMQ